LLRSERVSAGLTQLQLAKALGYKSMQFVSLIERGLSSPPNEYLGKVGVVLKIKNKKILQIALEDQKKQFFAGVLSGAEQQIKKNKGVQNV
jgi:transcriptional regulator with XRE-family HTH domain